MATVFALSIMYDSPNMSAMAHSYCTLKITLIVIHINVCFIIRDYSEMTCGF